MPEKTIDHKPLPINGQPSGLKVPKKHLKKNDHRYLWISGIVATTIVAVIAASYLWYNLQLSPVGSDIGQLKKITIPTGSTSGQIGKELEKQSIIRSSIAFDIYVRVFGKNNVLQAGTYRLSPAETTPQIIEHFVKGSIDTFSITFYPGATLTDTTEKTKSKKYDVTTILRKAGYSDTEITDGLKDTYVSTLFAGKPATADLEGYVYGETYNFNTGATVADILNGTFKEFYAKIQENNLVAGFSSHSLSLYQGITLASIVQREANKVSDQKQVAQVFYSRLSAGMPLGSDVTYQYIADKTGVSRDPNLDSPYNTRRFPGLPPGPISVPGLTALKAVAEPATGDYLYFLSGDDDVTYFAKTNAEHEANILAHCKVKCSTP